MKNFYYLLALYLGFLLLSISFFMVGMLATQILNVRIEDYKQFLYGISAALSAFYVISYFVKRKIIHINYKLGISLKYFRSIIFTGLALVVICHSLFSHLGGLSNEIGGKIVLNYVLPVIIILPIVREIIFRSGIQEILGRITNKHLAILVTSVLYPFSFVLPDLQFTPFHFLQLYFISIILGYIYHYTGSITIPIAINSLHYLFALIASQIK